ncbi:hypothetical protein ACIBAI_00750 [Streptomyces sp. NPDC051041]|uniref:hypothetical protein n=1 Tax=Streptomyces TaxID=1883 RepID=UPI0031DDF07A
MTSTTPVPTVGAGPSAASAAVRLAGHRHHADVRRRDGGRSDTGPLRARVVLGHLRAGRELDAVELAAQG